MKWLKIDPDNLPTGEVLSACFEPHTAGHGQKMMGYISNTGACLVCDNESETLHDITHYIDIHKHDHERE